MSASLRVALYVGLGLAVIALCARLWRYKGLNFPFGAFLECVGLAISPFPIPLLAEIAGKATQSKRLPIFNSPEQRVALFLGAAVLMGAVVTGAFAVLHRAFRSAPSN